MFSIVAMLAALLWPVAQAQVADWVLENANIYTVNPAAPKARAIAIKGSRIVAVGDVAKHIGPATRRVDAKGATVVPGLIDSHGHIAGLGDSLEILDLREAKSAADIAAQVAKAASQRKPGEWIRGRGWDQTRWPGAQFPSHELDQASPNNPVYLSRVDGHAAWVNQKAIEMSDINAATQDPSGGRILREKDGKPTGVLVDRAMGLVSRRIPPPDAEAVRRRIANAALACAKLGLTTVHDAGTGDREIQAYKALIANDGLKLRVYAMIGGAGPHWAQWLKTGPEVGEFLTVRSIKLVADGALGSRGAAMKEPYSDEPSHRGLTIIRQDEIERVAKQAVTRGFQVNTHAIGDAANRAVLDAYAAALGGENDKRFRVEHAQIVSLDDIPLFRRYSIIASVQATHATSDMRWAEKRIGSQRILGAYAWQRMLKAGVKLANGSDFPVESPDPMLGFYASVTRQDAEGYPRGGWQPAQILTREQALASWTLWGAYAAFEEKQKGSLEAGKLADFILLSQDIMTIPAKDILRTKVTMTVLGGNVVHDARP
ncbi:MAG: amidohydrolase [Bryobacterales bacterium]|nr:amidohydrolase [Bryobacterales bacterium]